MPDDFWSRKRKEEEEEERRRQDEKDRAELEAKRRRLKSGSAGAALPVDLPSGSDSERLTQLMEQSEPLIEQVNQLYLRYSTGEQARPPIELRNRLDSMITLMSNIAKGSSADRFRFSTVLASYQAYKTRWEKLLADVESGKIKRVTGPRR